MGYPGVIGYYRGLTGIIYNQMEDDIENEMDTIILLELVFLLSLVICYGLYRGYSGMMETIGKVDPSSDWKDVPRNLRSGARVVCRKGSSLPRCCCKFGASQQRRFSGL